MLCLVNFALPVIHYLAPPNSIQAVQTGGTGPINPQIQYPYIQTAFNTTRDGVHTIFWEEN